MSVAQHSARPRVLVIAEQANPGWISVPLVGWKHVEAIASFADVHVVTHARNRENILAAGFPARDLTFIEPGRLESGLARVSKLVESRGAMGGVTQNAFRVPMYYEFERTVWAQLGAQLARRGFDLVHRVTPLSPGVPSLIGRHLTRWGVPFVLGPLNGGVPWPRGFEEERRREGEWLGHARGIYRALPYYRATRRHASAILVGSAAAWREVPREYEAKLFYVPENAIDPARFARFTGGHEGKPLRAAFVGRLIACKGTAMLLRAAAPLVQRGVLELDIIGDGPERPTLLSLAAELGISAGVKLEGWVPHEQLQERLVSASVFAFAGIREFGGAVVMEAMALGLVPLVVDYGGPSEIVEDDCGLRVPLGSREEVVARLREGLTQLVEASPAQRRLLGERARARVLEHFSLAAKTRKTRLIYDWLLGRGQRPSLTPPPRSLALY